jgi:hypothetical protein
MNPIESKIRWSIQISLVLCAFASSLLASAGYELELPDDITEIDACIYSVDGEIEVSGNDRLSSFIRVNPSLPGNTLFIRSNGALTIKPVEIAVIGGDLILEAKGDIKNYGSLYTNTGDIRISSREKIYNYNSIAAGKDVNIRAKSDVINETLLEGLQLTRVLFDGKAIQEYFPRQM